MSTKDLWEKDLLFLLPSCQVSCELLHVKDMRDGTFTCGNNEACKANAVRKQLFAEKMDKRIEELEA